MGFMMQIRPEVLKLREDYPPGCHAEPVWMFEGPQKGTEKGCLGTT